MNVDVCDNIEFGGILRFPFNGYRISFFGVFDTYVVDVPVFSDDTVGPIERERLNLADVTILRIEVFVEIIRLTERIAVHEQVVNIPVIRLIREFVHVEVLHKRLGKRLIPSVKKLAVLLVDELLRTYLFHFFHN